MTSTLVDTTTATEGVYALSFTGQLFSVFLILPLKFRNIANNEINWF